jgi:phosphoenolpyruvate phosphomutase
MVVALVLATFDIFHEEHAYFLNEAAKLGEVTVGLGTDRYQKDYKRPPLRTYEERKALLRQLPMVADVVPRESVDITPLLDDVKPAWLVAGVDWVDGPVLEKSGITRATLADRRINLAYICSPRKVSSTDIIRRSRTSGLV